MLPREVRKSNRQIYSLEIRLPNKSQISSQFFVLSWNEIFSRQEFSIGKLIACDQIIRNELRQHYLLILNLRSKFESFDIELSHQQIRHVGSLYIIDYAFLLQLVISDDTLDLHFQDNFLLNIMIVCQKGKSAPSFGKIFPFY